MGVSSNADKMVGKALLIGCCGALFGDKWSSSILFQAWLEKMTLIKLRYQPLCRPSLTKCFWGMES